MTLLFKKTSCNQCFTRQTWVPGNFTWTGSTGLCEGTVVPRCLIFIQEVVSTDESLKTLNRPHQWDYTVFKMYLHFSTGLYLACDKPHWVEINSCRACSSITFKFSRIALGTSMLWAWKRVLAKKAILVIHTCQPG